MAKRNTKELIMYTALRLFSDKGFDGVGLREIAAKVGVRESAIYRHYCSKQDIFDSIILTMNARYDPEMMPIEKPGQVSSVLTIEDVQKDLYRMCLLLFQNYLFDEHGAQLRRMLTIEQVKDSSAGRNFRKRMIEDTLDYIAGAFEKLIELDYYRTADPQVMSLQFYSPLYLLLLRFDRQPDCGQAVIHCLDSHIREFDAMYRKHGNTQI